MAGDFAVAIRRSSNLPHIRGRTTSRSKDGRRTRSSPLAPKTLKWFIQKSAMTSFNWRSESAARITRRGRELFDDTAGALLGRDHRAQLLLVRLLAFSRTRGFASGGFARAARLAQWALERVEKLRVRHGDRGQVF